jgi:hypothetical protein
MTRKIVQSVSSLRVVEGQSQEVGTKEHQLCYLHFLDYFARIRRELSQIMQVLAKQVGTEYRVERSQQEQC